VALPPGEPDTVYVAGSAEAPGTGGTATVFRIVKSTDAGNSWATSWEPADPGTALLQLVADPNDPQTVVASTGASIYRTVDGGLTWKAGNLRGTVRGLAIEHGPRRRVLAWELVGDPRLPLHTAFFVSSDQGLTWRPRPADFAGQALDGLVTDPTAPGAFYAFDAFGQLFHSGDVGLHWQPEGPTPNGPVHDLAPDPLRPGVAFVAVDGGRLGRTLWKTAHFGAAWTLFQSGISAGDFLTVTPDPANPATLWAGAGALGGSVPGGSPLSVWKSTDRGASWTAAGLQAALVPAIGFGSQGSQGSQGRQHRLFAATLGSQLQKSDDGGRTWSPIAATGYFVEALAIPAEEPATVYALSDRVTAIGLDVSLDNGATWKTRRANALILTVAPGSPATLYADQGIDGGPEARSGVQRSTDRGVTWTTLLELPAGSVRAIAIDPATPRRIVAGFERRDENGELHGGIEISRDYGATWREVGLAPGSPGVLSLLADPLVPHGFLAGTRSGVYASPDGLTWTLLGEGLPRIPVIHLSAGPGASHTLYAATEGGGIYNLERTAP
jgi:hypothetical protein